MSFFMWRYFIPLFSSEYFRLCGYFLDGSHIIIISNSLQIGFSKKFCTPVLRVSIFDKIDFLIGLPIDYTVTPTRFYFFSFTSLEICFFLNFQPTPGNWHWDNRGITEFLLKSPINSLFFWHHTSSRFLHWLFTVFFLFF